MLVNHRDTLPSIPKGAAAVQNSYFRLKAFGFLSVEGQNKTVNNSDSNS